MRNVRLQTVTCPLTGELGLAIKGMRMTDGMSAAGEGTLIAHDLLEHQNGIKSIGSVGDEIEALAAVWFIRGQFGELRRNSYSIHSVEESLAYDIANLCEIYMRGVPMRGVIKRTHAHQWDDTFDSIIQMGVKTFRRETNDPIDSLRLRQFKREAKHLMRSGCRKAENRFGDSIAANNQFWSIADAVQPYAKNAEWEGQEFVLRYGKGEATCQEYYEPEW